MNMKTNSSTIKVFVVLSMFSIKILYGEYSWTQDVCMDVGCKGCGTKMEKGSVREKVETAADKIDERHGRLEQEIAKKYNDEILEANINVITKIQNGITKSVARIKAMEHQANIDSKHLIFLLRKNKELYTVPLVRAGK